MNTPLTRLRAQQSGIVVPPITSYPPRRRRFVKKKLQLTPTQQQTYTEVEQYGADLFKQYTAPPSAPSSPTRLRKIFKMS